MRINTSTRYSVRALFDLAFHGGGGPTQVKDISRRQNLSQRYLEQIFNRLVRKGILKSKRGPHGGYMLARDPAGITVADIILAAQGPIVPVQCLVADESLIKDQERYATCVTRTVWAQTQKIIEDYVKFLDSTSIMPFMKVLGDLQSIHARKVVIDALIFLGPKDIVTLARGLSDSRWYVVRNIIYILRKIGDKRAVEYLLKTVRHGDIRVKKEVIRALGELGGANVVVALRDCLDDEDIQVRSSALKALGNIGSEASKRIIMDRIGDKRFRDRDFDEKKEYFEVLSRWKDSEVFSFLVKRIRNKSFFLTAKDYEEKSCVAYCFGLIGNRDALPVLNKFRGSGNKLLREMTTGAIKRLEHVK